MMVPEIKLFEQIILIFQICYNIKMNVEIRKLSDIDDMRSVSMDLTELLKNDANHDIVDDFPNTVARYVENPEIALETLTTSKSQIVTGKTEMFIALVGERAVGLSIVTNEIMAPIGVDPSHPNLSGFVCVPFRGHGIGRLSLEARIKVVNENFNGNAWTFVARNNSISKHLITSVGFIEIEGDRARSDNRQLYVLNQTK